jgi:glycosyltransferase involved in cell wall biosynthesis
MENEPFGIAIVEAMASGCVPIIPTSCGAWRDVLESRQGYYGYGYGRYMEVPSYLAKLEDEDTYLELARRAVERAKQFGAESFRRKILEALSRHPKMRSKA